MWGAPLEASGRRPSSGQAAWSILSLLPGFQLITGPECTHTIIHALPKCMCSNTAVDGQVVAVAGHPVGHVVRKQKEGEQTGVRVCKGIMPGRQPPKEISHAPHTEDSCMCCAAIASIALHTVLMMAMSFKCSVLLTTGQLLHRQQHLAHAQVCSL